MNNNSVINQSANPIMLSDVNAKKKFDSGKML